MKIKANANKKKTKQNKTNKKQKTNHINIAGDENISNDCGDVLNLIIISGSMPLLVDQSPRGYQSARGQSFYPNETIQIEIGVLNNLRPLKDCGFINSIAHGKTSCSSVWLSFIDIVLI